MAIVRTTAPKKTITPNVATGGTVYRASSAVNPAAGGGTGSTLTPEQEAMRLERQKQNEEYMKLSQEDKYKHIGEVLAANPGLANLTGAPLPKQEAPLVEQQQIISAPASQPSQGTPQSLIDQLNAARRAQVLADLGKSRDNALSNLSGERSAIAPKYYDQRNQVAAGAQQNARNFAEFMAARGGTSSGANAQAELSRNMSTQGNLGTLGRQEAADFSDIERRTTGVNNAYESDVASANAGIEGDRMKALLNDYYTQQQRELQIAGLMGQFQGQQTRSAMESDRNYGYQVGRDTVSDNQWQQQYDRNVELSDRDYNYQVGRDDVSDAQWAKEFAESVRQSGIDNALSQARASSGGSGGTKDLSLAQKISIWKISGQAPEGIPGVTPGAKVYDAVAARQAAEKSGGVKLWDAIKGVINSVAGGSSGISDSDISNYLK